MKKRDALIALLILGVAPFVANAQPAKAIPRIGILWHAASAAEEAPYFGTLIEAFSKLG